MIVLSAIYAICIPQSAISQPDADFDVVEGTIDSIQAAMRSGGLSCTKLVQKYLDRIAAYDQVGPKLNAVQNVNPRALQQAADLDAKFKKLDESKEWYLKLIATDPKRQTGYYSLGVIDWLKTYPVRMTARSKLGMKPEEPGPIKDKKVREGRITLILPRRIGEVFVMRDAPSDRLRNFLAEAA